LYTSARKTYFVIWATKADKIHHTLIYQMVQECIYSKRILCQIGGLHVAGTNLTYESTGILLKVVFT